MYRWQGQLSPLADAGHTNLMGNGWLLGAGARYSFMPQWALQGAVSFLGDYAFVRKTYASEDDGLFGALGVKLKLQYSVASSLPLAKLFEFGSSAIQDRSSSQGFVRMSRKWLVSRARRCPQFV